MISFRNFFRFSQKEITFAFDHILEKKYYRGLKLLRASPPPETTTGKLLVITPRAAGKANKRNLIRRRIKNIFYQEQCYKEPFTWIIIVSEKATKIDFDALKKFLVISTTQTQPILPKESP